MTSDNTSLQVCTTPSDLSALTDQLRADGRSIALVPTMGALHDGHMQLVRAAKKLPNATVIVSIFVNPLQFGPTEDLDSYPRTLSADLDLLAAEGVDVAFAPTANDMYPHGYRSTVNPGPLATELEGATRPGHFAGALTVCAKLFGISRANHAFFGEKDYQQLVLLKQMVEDLNLPITLHPVPIRREESGLALSSRNRYLSAEEHALTQQLSASLRAGAAAADNGATPREVVDATRAHLAQYPQIDVDYVEIRDAGLQPLGDYADATVAARLLLAARVGTTRLIDNIGLMLQPWDY